MAVTEVRSQAPATPRGGASSIHESPSLPGPVPCSLAGAQVMQRHMVPSLGISNAHAEPSASLQARTLPAVGPRPPEISTLYLDMALVFSAAQSTPSGTCMG